MTESQQIVQRIFTAAAQSLGSVALLALDLGLPMEEVALYVVGAAIPPDDVLRAVTGILLRRLGAIEFDRMRGEFSRKAWYGMLRQPGGDRG